MAMRARACAPGSAIVAGDSFPLVPDLFLGWAFEVRKRWGRTVVIDEGDHEWVGGVTVLPPGEFELVEAVRGGVRYPAARPLRGRSQWPERPVGALALPSRVPATAAAMSSSTTKEAHPDSRPGRASQITESGAFSS
ncbi:hypothetical protein A6410_05455 [Prescottella equi]|nr:hypothetical protein A6410_05455 [Prescottella equi]